MISWIAPSTENLNLYLHYPYYPMKYTNPIIPGFHPDPSICRVEEDYYLVNSSFEYFPGVPIFHSRDLMNWHQIGHCLTRESQLPLRGVKASDGIYAPTIRYHEGRFYMVTTNMTGGGNFYVWTEDPAGEWSEPIWVAQKGIDPSLLFDNGKVYFTSNGTGWASVRGAYQCEIDIATGKQLSESKFLWTGTGGSYPEAPHLYHIGDWYYLTVAEGGTAEGHCVTIARSHDPYGPFESCPHNPILTHRSLMNEIQATGHADLIEDHHGNWWAVFLGYRYGEYSWHHLGRETYLAPVEWTTDGWPVVNGGNKVMPIMEVNRPMLPCPWPASLERDDFDSPVLGFEWNYLRNPDYSHYSLTARPGWLQLSCAAPTIDELASPSFIGRRQEHFDCSVSTLLEFKPDSENEEAGLVVLADNLHHCEIVVTLRGENRCVVVRRRIGTLSAEVSCRELPDGPVELMITADKSAYRFFAGPPGSLAKCATAETRYLSTQVAGGYTGAYFGLYATGNGADRPNKASFDWFDYRVIDKKPE